jgi:methionyl aminopeptidase
MRIPLKTDAQIDKMRQAGLVVWAAHQAAAALIEPGMTTAEIDAAVDRTIADHGGVPLFKGVPGKVPFPTATCISINSEIVHGIPGPRRLREGDVVSIDIGVKLDGWCGDAAVTHPVGEISTEARRLLDVTEEALRLAIRQIRPKLRWNQVARAIQGHIEGAGFHVIEQLDGHGIGRELWEKPRVSNRASAGDFKLLPGMVLAVEPMVGAGTGEVEVLDDHWTFVTADRSPAAHFEHTIAITADGPRVLTAAPDGTGWALADPGPKTHI